MAIADYTNHEALSQIVPHAQLVQDFYPRDPLFKALPWLALDGRMLRVPRSASFFYGVAGGFDSGQDLTAGSFRNAITWNDHQFKLKTIGTERLLDRRIVSEMSSPNIQEQYAIQAGTEAVINRYSDYFINGVEAGPDFEQFDGIDTMVTGGQTVASSGALLGDLDHLIYLITAGEGVPTAFLTHPSGIRAIRAQAYMMGFEIRGYEHPVFGVRTHFAGIPILPNDYIAVTGGEPTYYTDVFAVYLGIGTGLAGLFPAINGQMGVRVEKRDKDSEDINIYKITLECGLALFMESAIGKLENIDVTDYYDPEP